MKSTAIHSGRMAKNTFRKLGFSFQRKNFIKKPKLKWTNPELFNP